jgi:hypothetical protein
VEEARTKAKEAAAARAATQHLRPQKRGGAGKSKKARARSSKKASNVNRP